MTKKKEVIDWKIVCFGLGCLTVLELYTLNQNINGWKLSVVIGIIASVIGISIPRSVIIKILKGGAKKE